MGQSSSAIQVHASIWIPTNALLVSHVRFTYKRVSCCCCRRRRRIAAFTFPLQAWRALPQGAMTNRTVKAASMRLARLSRRDPWTPVTATGVAGTTTALFTVSLHLWELLFAMDPARKGQWTPLLRLVLLPVSEPDAAAAPSDASTREYALYCNGWRCGGDEALPPRTEPAPRRVEDTPPGPEGGTDARPKDLPPGPEGGTDARPKDLPLGPEGGTDARLKDLPPGSEGGTDTRPKEMPPLPYKSKPKGPTPIPRQLWARPRPPVRAGTYEVRVIVHSVHGATTLGEFFPDVYVKARMRHSDKRWCRTDVHYNSVHGLALFEYRLVLPPFRYPLEPRRWNRRKRLRQRLAWGRQDYGRKLRPLLEVVVMDEDQFTSDDTIGAIKLHLEKLIAPDELESCGLCSLNNEKINLFEASAVQAVQAEDASFPREVTGHWPVIRTKSLSRQKISTCSVRMTIQLLSQKEASTCPAHTGNKPGPGNQYPTLTAPVRQHGRLRDKLFYAQLQMFQSALLFVTGIANMWLFVAVLVLIVFAFLSLEVDHVTFLASKVYTRGSEFAEQHPIITRVSVVLCGMLFIFWLYFWELLFHSEEELHSPLIPQEEKEGVSAATRLCGGGRHRSRKGPPPPGKGGRARHDGRGTVLALRGAAGRGRVRGRRASRRNTSLWQREAPTPAC